MVLSVGYTIGFSALKFDGACRVQIGGEKKTIKKRGFFLFQLHRGNVPTTFINIRIKLFGTIKLIFN